MTIVKHTPLSDGEPAAESRMSAAVAGRWRCAINALRATTKRIRDLRQLQQMDDRLIRDIGLRHDDVRRMRRTGRFS
ncbi:hypothetical protein [Arhodomonas sp. AD133]|uniref:hypothetical protein n=1 Tax=Arhodomonas sp. AD133 TaxID=3415009 RepID=UPI003EBD3892